MKNAILTALFVAVPTLAIAADLPKVVTKAATTTPCTVTSCSGFYAGVNLSGQGSNADILGSGINGSIFAGGGMIGGQAGYEWWNGQYMFAFEAGADGVVTTGNAAVDDRLFAWEGVKLGLALQGLFGAPTAPAAPSQAPSPIQVPAFLLASLASPYVQFGAAERLNGTGWYSGAGAVFVLAQNWGLDVNYKHVDYSGQPGNPVLGITAVPKTDDIVTVGLNYHF